MSKKQLTWHVSIGAKNPRINIDKFVATGQLLGKFEKEITARIEQPALREIPVYMLDKDYDIILIDARKIVISKGMNNNLSIFLYANGIIVIMFRPERIIEMDKDIEAKRKADAEALKAKREAEEIKRKAKEEPEDNREPQEKNGED